MCRDCARVVALPDDRGLLAAGGEVAVDAVGRDVELAVLEPPDRRRCGSRRGVLDPAVGLDPVEPLALLAPERVRIGDRGRVHRGVAGRHRRGRGRRSRRVGRGSGRRWRRDGGWCRSWRFLPGIGYSGGPPRGAHAVRQEAYRAMGRGMQSAPGLSAHRLGEARLAGGGQHRVAGLGAGGARSRHRPRRARASARRGRSRRRPPPPSPPSPAPPRA